MIGNTEILENVPVIYFISDGCGHVKVGIASNIKNRLVTLQVSSAFELKILHLKYGETIDQVREWESEYHYLLSDHHIRGEWYEEKFVIELLEGKEPDCKHYLCEDPNFNFCEFAESLLSHMDEYLKERRKK